MPINESYHILSIRSLRKFTRATKSERKSKQSLELSILTRELYVSVFRHVSASHLENVYCLN